jgi:hypothetical protein
LVWAEQPVVWAVEHFAAVVVAESEFAAAAVVGRVFDFRNFFVDRTRRRLVAQELGSEYLPFVRWNCETWDEDEEQEEEDVMQLCVLYPSWSSSSWSLSGRLSCEPFPQQFPFAQSSLLGSQQALKCLI